MSVRIMSLKLNRVLLYGALLLAALIFLVVLLVKLIPSGSPSAEAAYYPGTYTTSVALGTGSVTVQMVFSEDGIESVYYDIPDAVQTVYPLVQGAATSIGKQLTEGIDIASVRVDSASSETAEHLLKAMRLTVEKARAN